MTPTAALLPDGVRLHLNHGPIDLILSADGPGPARQQAYAAAAERFDSVLTDLVAELPLLRMPLTPDAAYPDGDIARRMDTATRPHANAFITRMAAVAGAVADTILQRMVTAAPLHRAYVNNGGDIALYLEGTQQFVTAMRSHSGADIGRIVLTGKDGIGGIATSGRHGRSQSLGIADSVTVLAPTAAAADAAATLIANAVDLPGHPAITRAPANTCDPDSDLGARAVVTGCGPLSAPDIALALDAGLHRARQMKAQDHIIAAALCLGDDIRLLGDHFTTSQRSLAHA